jgi:hypothetical protein
VITPISLLPAIVLWLRAASLNSFKDSAYGGLVTLCEAYMGIEPHFDLWNYFFRARLWQSSDAKVAVLGSVDLLVQFRSRVDPYFIF